MRKKLTSLVTGIHGLGSMPRARSITGTSGILRTSLITVRITTRGIAGIGRMRGLIRRMQVITTGCLDKIAPAGLRGPFRLAFVVSGTTVSSGDN